MAGWKHCPKCEQNKLLTTEFWLPRKDSKDGFRGICRLCWYAQQRPGKRRHYARHAERIRAERRADRRRRPERRRLADLRYYLKNRERKLIYNYRYYWQNHERILEQKRWYCTHRRPLRIDLGPEMPNTRNVDMYHWQQEEERRQVQRTAAVILAMTMRALTAIERRLLLAFESADYDLSLAANGLGITLADAEKCMKGIRRVATRAKTAALTA